jgi:o-succinylbenzoate synthase
VQIRLARHLLPLAAPIATARGSIAERAVWLVRLDDGGGRIGLGEAAPLSSFGTENSEQCLAALRAALEGDALTRFEAWLERGRPSAPLGREAEAALAKSPCARAALEGALIDLMAQRQGVPIAHLLAAMPTPMTLPVNALVSGPAERVGEDAALAVTSGFSCVKIKLTGDPDADLKRLETTRSACGPDIVLRCDANGAYDATGARELGHAAAALHLEYWEQPIAPGQPDQLAALRRAGLRIAADEDIRTAADVGRLGVAQAADVVVLKPAFLGGWRPTMQAAELARTCGMDVVITTTLDGAVGRAHAAHATAALGLVHRAHGLSAHVRRDTDLTSEPLVTTNGGITLRDVPGLGIGALRNG